MNASHVFYFLVFVILVTCQKLSRERMVELFKDTNATETDIDDLVSHVNSYHMKSNKQKAAVRWIRHRAGINKNIRSEYEKCITTFIADLCYAHNYLLNGAHKRLRTVLTEEFQAIDEWVFDQLDRQYVVDQELFGNDVSYAEAKFTADLMKAMNFQTEELSMAQIREMTYVARHFFEDKLKAANKNLGWKKLYEDLNTRKKQPLRDYYFNLLLSDLKLEFNF